VGNVPGFSVPQKVAGGELQFCMVEEYLHADIATDSPTPVKESQIMKGREGVPTK